MPASRTISTPCWRASTDGRAPDGAGICLLDRSETPSKRPGTGLGQRPDLIVVCADRPPESRQGPAPPMNRVRMSRTIRQRLLAGVGAAIVLAGLPLFALADTEINARGWSHDRYGRLVFDRAARLTTGAEIKGRKLIITFSEPVSVKLTGALENLKGYV